MIVIMKKGASKKDIEGVLKVIKKHKFKAHLSRGVEITIIGVIGNEKKMNNSFFVMLPGVEKVVSVVKPYRLASREFKQEDTIIKVGNVSIGTNKIVVIAGPCSVESRDQLLRTAKSVKEAGATILRGGAFKPRTSPYSFQGMGEKGLKLLAEARKVTGLSIVT